MSEPVISLENVGVVYRLARSRRVSIKEFVRNWIGGALSYTEFHALQDVSFSVASGESVAIIGGNGAGKSTLLKVIAGALYPTTGSAHVQGGLSVVLTGSACFDTELTGIENIYLAALLQGRTRAEVTAALDSIVATTGLGQFIDSPLKSYSSGMYGRLSFAVSMAWPMDLLLVDESLSAGDAAFVERCLERVLELRRRGQTLVMVSHSASTVLEFCDRAVWLDKGKIIADGPAAEILHKYENSGRSADL